MDQKGHIIKTSQISDHKNISDLHDFVLEKSIFSNIFEKDIRRVYIYKKTERLAKALFFVSPAFVDFLPIKDKIESIAITLLDEATLPLKGAKNTLSRALLSLSGLLGVAEVSGALSPMNAKLIAREAHFLLQEVASYEEPNLALPDGPTLADLLRNSTSGHMRQSQKRPNRPRIEVANDSDKRTSKGHQKDISIKDTSPRLENIVSILKQKSPAYIKDISTLMREVSEKTIQRDLAALVKSGQVTSFGKKRWTTYSLSSPKNPENA